jgi:hypothetical protein
MGIASVIHYEVIHKVIPNTILSSNDNLSIGKKNKIEMKIKGPGIRPMLDALFLSIGKMSFFILNYLCMYDRI